MLSEPPLQGLYERGKAGGHKAQHFPLPCHILAFCNVNALILFFKNVIIAGRVKLCGMEDEDRRVVAYGCRKTKS